MQIPYLEETVFEVSVYLAHIDIPHYLVKHQVLTTYFSAYKQNTYIYMSLLTIMMW